MPVNSERLDYQTAKKVWKRLRDCFGGRDAVLKAGEEYVPRLAGADSTANEAYRQRGNFYNAVARTVTGMNGALFQDEPKVEDAGVFEDYLDDVTLTGVPFETFAVDAGKEIFLVGRYGVLIDFPEETAREVRPYVVGYPAENIINWKTTRVNGDEQLSMVVLTETAKPFNGAKDDMFQETRVMQWRVLWVENNICYVQLWQENPNKKTEQERFIPDGPPVPLTRRNVALDFIPFVFLGVHHATSVIEQPLLIDLADVNLAHWRNSVDHEYGLHLVALPTPWASGIKGSVGPNPAPMKLGPSVVWELELNGSAGMLEFSGSGLASLVAAMDEKKKQMATLGARLLEDTPAGAETATSVRMRHSGDHASLRTVAGSMEQGFTAVLQMLFWWAGTEATPKDPGVEVEINKEFLNTKAQPQEIQTMLTALQAGEISYETWYEFLRAGGWTRDGVSVEDEKKAIAERKKERMAQEPPIDPELSPGDPSLPPKKTAKNIIRDPKTGLVSRIEEE